jgi:hypothetical protein
MLDFGSSASLLRDQRLHDGPQRRRPLERAFDAGFEVDETLVEAVSMRIRGVGFFMPPSWSSP